MIARVSGNFPSLFQDMEKWAKAMNKKDAQKEQQKSNAAALTKKESAAADAGFSILQKTVSWSLFHFLPLPVFDWFKNLMLLLLFLVGLKI